MTDARTHEGMPAAQARREQRRIAAVCLGLLALLGLTLGVTQVDLGWGNVVANLGIATLKALLILWFFMHLREYGPLLRFFAVASAVWLGILFAFGLSDWLTRGL